MEHLGTKANLPDLLACFLPDQIKTIDERLYIREAIALNYENSLQNSRIAIPTIKTEIIHSRHLFPIHVGIKIRDKALAVLGELQIGATVNYRAVPTLDYYLKKYKIDRNDYPNSISWGEGTISIPLFPGMTEKEQEYVIEVLVNKIDKLIGKN
jgi:dTDP-4-amino-4,6-dideoxygalactose transaminase